jgi:hypothetical protein
MHADPIPVDSSREMVGMCLFADRDHSCGLLRCPVCGPLPSTYAHFPWMDRLWMARRPCRHYGRLDGLPMWLA